ncbi:MAG: hypothetical protein AB1523_13575 [Bacillota bacterium]
MPDIMNDVDSDLKIFLEMTSKPVEQNFIELTKEITELGKEQVLSEKEFNIIIERLFSSYVESLANKLIVKNFEALIRKGSLIS